MVLHSLLSLAVLGLCALLLLTQPQQALGSSRGPPGLIGGEVIAPPPGMCAIAVAIHGYQCQEFDVTTDDGYILSVQRIPQGRAGGGGNNKQPVLLQHGVLVDGMTWLLNSPDESLAFILADSGFDVWISNIRGTRFSRRHIALNPRDSEFWNWTWDDLVTHDLSSVIDFVFKQTGQKMDYVGHSMGTLIALASFSEGRQIDKVKSAALLSPIAYLSHMTTALGDVAAKAFVGEITTLIGLAEFNPNEVHVANFLKALCAQSGVDCYDLLTALTDFPENKLRNSFQGSGSGFSGSTLHGICFGWFMTEEVNAVPTWLLNLWRNGNGNGNGYSNGNGTGVFIPNIVKSKRRRKSRGRNSERRRKYNSVANLQE